ncbi:hypothetical protein Dip518_001039 [Parelusimicrobium proximum]|uniref:hypothetical protein n=1 Tax=Parelusimicrobium proximum TaxID=3228953 RepID=UPI003D16EBBE
MELMYLLVVAGIGIGHTVLAPNHYLPFIVLGKVNNWGIGKTLSVTALCGLAHIIGSTVLGLVGAFLGYALINIEGVDEYRHIISAGILVLFGLLYFIWGLQQALQSDGCGCGCHNHSGHVHVDEKAASKSAKKTIAILFLAFLVAPCEMWIPLISAPAVEGSKMLVILVIAVFSLSTVFSMLAMTAAGYFGAKFLPFKSVEKYGHAIAGFVILLCGVVMFAFEHSHDHHHHHHHDHSHEHHIHAEHHSH